MRVDFSELDPSQVFSRLVETLPVLSLGFVEVQHYLNDENFVITNKFRETLTALNQERCHHCSYPKAPFSFLSNVKLSGSKSDVGLLSKLPQPEHIVPQFVYHPSCNVAQLQGVKPLCQSCFSIYVSLIGALADGTNFTESRAWSRAIIPCFNGELGVDVTELQNIVTHYIERYENIVKNGVSWDLTYLYNRGLIDDRSAFTGPATVDNEGPEKNEFDKNNKAGKTKTHDQVKDSYIKDADARKLEAIKKAQMADAQRSKNIREQAKDNMAAGWNGLNNHLATQNPTDEIMAKVADGAYDVGPDYLEKSTMRAVRDDDKDDVQIKADVGVDDEKTAVNNKAGEMPEGGVRVNEQDSYDSLKAEALGNDEVNESIKKNKQAGTNHYTGANDELDTRGVPGHKDE